MHFTDLMSLPFDAKSDVVDLDEIRAALPDVPEEVAVQVYSEHGRKAAFQQRYGHIKISNLKWHLRELPANRLVGAGSQFEGHVQNVAGRVADLEKTDWKSLDPRTQVVEHWRAHQTWLVPPILLAANLVGAEGALWLVEGHTRFGALLGLLKEGRIAPTSLHKVWLGTADAV